MTEEVIGKRLRAARRAADKTQQEAAQALKLTRPVVSQIEAGLRRVRVGELFTLAELYKVEVKELLADEA